MKPPELPEEPFVLLFKDDGPDDPPLPEGWSRISMAVVIPLDEEDDGALDEEGAPRSAD